MKRILVCSAIAALLLIGGPGLAQDVGDKVVVVGPRTMAYAEDGDVAFVSQGTSLIVEEVKDDAVRVTHRKAGWISRSDVIPFADAVEHFTREIAAAPRNADLYVARGNVRFELMQVDEAIADFSEAIRLDPENPAAFHGRGGALAAKGDSAKAITDYGEAIRLDARAISYYARGCVLHRSGDFEKAMEDFNEAIRLDPNDAATLRAAVRCTREAKSTRL